MAARRASPLLLPLLLLLAGLAAAAPAPVRYDQRQEGDFNVHAHLENIVLVLIPATGGSGGGIALTDFLKKAGANVRTQEHPIQAGLASIGVAHGEHSLASEASEAGLASIGVAHDEHSLASEDSEAGLASIGVAHDEHSLSSEASEVTEVKEQQQQGSEQPQQQQQREGQEELQEAASEPLKAVLVAESPALLLARADPHRGSTPGSQPAPAGLPPALRRQTRAMRMEDRGDGCPQGQFRDATGVCHYIGSDQRVGEQYYIGLVPPSEK